MQDQEQQGLRRVNIAEVAATAGVGVGTVSRVLNGNVSVRASTRLRVLEVIERLQYQPSRLAAGLSRGTPSTVAMLVPYLTRPSVVERLAGAIDALDEEGYDVVVCNVETPLQRDRHLDRLLAKHRADGVIIVSLILDAEQLSAFERVHLPVVLVDSEASVCPHTVIDDRVGGRMATDHLIGLGHIRIGFIGDDDRDGLGFRSTGRRLAGYRQALVAAGLPCDDEMIARGGHSAAEAASMAERLLLSPVPPTAVFACSDTQAMGVLGAADRIGLAVPHELSVIGFDDVEAASLLRLTTVRQPLRLSGSEGAHRMCAVLRGEKVRPLKQVLSLEVVTRASTAPVPVRSSGRPPPGQSQSSSEQMTTEPEKTGNQMYRPEVKIAMESSMTGTAFARKSKRGWRRAIAVSGAAMTATASAVALMGLPAVAAPHQAPHQAGSTTITWWASPITSSNPDPRTVLITAFEKANPSIHVTLISAPNDTDTNRATLTTQISGGAASPDVYMGDVIWPAQFGAHQLAKPLSGLLSKSYFAGFAPGLVAGATYKGQVYGAPFFEDQGFLYYRKDLLTAANLPVPKTWQQLESEAQQLQKAGKIKYGFVWQGASYEGTTADFMEYLADAGGKVLNSSVNKSTLNSPAAVKALTFMRSLVSTGVTPAAISTFQESQAMSTFAAGQSLFLRNWDYGYSTANATGSTVIGKVGVAPLPSFSASSYPGYSNIGGWNLYLNPHTTHQSADLTFIKWMTASQAQNILATQFSEIPTNEAVRVSPSVVKTNPVLATVPKTRLVPRPANTPFYPAVSQAIYQNVNAALSGSATPAAAIGAASSAIDTAIGGSGL